MLGLSPLETIIAIIWFVVTIAALVQITRLSHLPFLKRTGASILALLFPIVGAAISLYLLTRWEKTYQTRQDDA